jgi:hypothetical protein
MLDTASYIEIFESLVGGGSKTNVKEFGEVYTPLSLVNEMLDSLHPVVWSNSKLQWFEPACGLAPFLFVSYQRLMLGLEPEFPDPTSREKHILEQMFTFNELQEKNITVLHKLFRAEHYKLRIYSCDFLTSSDFDSLRFDVIVGNPPYQRNGSSNTGNTIWDKFLRRILESELLTRGGFLVFVHPPLWRKPDSAKSKNKGLFTLLAHQHQLHRLSIHDVKDGVATFGCQTKYDWYCLEKVSAHTKTRVSSMSGVESQVDLRQWTWLPNDRFASFLPLLAVGNEARCPVLFERSAYGTDKNWTSAIEDTTFCYPLIRTTSKSGIRYMWSRVDDRGMFGVSKVVFGDNCVIHTVVEDVEGKYGMTEHAIGIQVANAEEARDLKNALSSPVFAQLLECCIWSSRQLDWRLFTNFKAGFWNALPTSEPIHVQEVVEGLDPVKLSLSVGRAGYTILELQVLCSQLRVGFRKSEKKADLVARIQQHQSA